MPYGLIRFLRLKHLSECGTGTRTLFHFAEDVFGFSLLIWPGLPYRDTGYFIATGLGNITMYPKPQNTYLEDMLGSRRRTMMFWGQN